MWELDFSGLPEESRKIATERLKWSLAYQKKHHIASGPAKDLPPEVDKDLASVCKRVYRNLRLSGYARIDIRLRDDGRVFVMEANPNPQLAYGEDFAESAEKAGLEYRGAVGVVTNATARDTDEIATEKVPLYFRRPGRVIRPGRNEIESVNRPVVCGGVLVVPGDVVVADGDGVLVVPRAVAADVARYARRILEGDKEGRRRLYEKLGLPKDKSVE